MSSYLHNLFNFIDETLIYPMESDDITDTNKITYKDIAKITSMSVIGCSLLKTGIRRILTKTNFYKSIKNSRMIELNIIAVLHSILLTGYGIKQTFFPNTFWYKTTGCGHIISISLGYFIHDTIACYSSWKKDPTMLLHHLSCIGLNSSVLYVPKIYPLCAPFAIAELSSIFLNIMYTLHSTNQKNTILSTLNLGAFVSTFFVTRIVWMPYILIRFFNKEPIIQVKCAQWLLSVLCSLNFWWFNGILKKVYKIICNKKLKKK